MSEEEKECLAHYYSPSMWNKRMDPGEVVDYHVNICTSHSENVCKNSHWEPSVCYGEKKAKMDIFYPSQENYDTAVNGRGGICAPVVLFVHGGYWQAGSRKTYSFVSNSWTKAGCVAAVVCYNLAPEASLHQMVSEIKSAVKYFNTRFPKSKLFLFLCGHSAGAHLCTMMMVSDWSKDPSIPQAIHGMFLLSGVFDLVPIVNTYVNDALKLTEESAAQISPQQILIKMLPTIACPILVVIEEHGSPEFHRQAKEFVEILKKVIMFSVLCLSYQE